MAEVARVVTGELVAPVGAVDAAEDLYREWLLRCRSDRTREAYARDFRYWLEFLADVAGVHDPLAATGRHVAAWMRVLERTPLPRTGKPPSTATIARRVAVVSSYYKLGVRLELLTRNPVDYVDRPEVDPDNSETRGLTEDESRRLIAAAFGLVASAGGADVRRVADRDAVMVAVMLTTGLRIAEVCSLTVEDLGYDRAYRVVRVTRKGGKRQALPLGPAAALVDARIKGRTSGPLFPTRSGKHVKRSWARYALQRMAAAADIPEPHKISPHSLRHTYATLSLDNGATLDQLQDALGHADPRTTRRYDRNRHRIDDSPTHMIGALLLSDQPQKRRLF